MPRTESKKEFVVAVRYQVGPAGAPTLWNHQVIAGSSHEAAWSAAFVWTQWLASAVPGKETVSVLSVRVV